jgi:transposase-like protein
MPTTDLGPRPDDPADLAAWYRRALALQASSGLGVTAFAERNGISPSTLYLWRRRQEAGEPSTSSDAVLAASNTSGLLELRFADNPGAAKSSITVRLQSGIELEVPASFDTDSLRRVLEVLAPC